MMKNLKIKVAGLVLAVGIAGGLMAVPAGASAPVQTNPNASCIAQAATLFGGIGQSTSKGAFPFGNEISPIAQTPIGGQTPC
jgi:hypothetical protein